MVFVLMVQDKLLLFYLSGCAVRCRLNLGWVGFKQCSMCPLFLGVKSREVPSWVLVPQEVEQVNSIKK
ncbi:MAG: hypothetical protein CSA33_03405 [Desulfobulbus propionicus]|nr:MAG: hypothetical protein CSA33_03405 [Desulfobulbus propionicus]